MPYTIVQPRRDTPANWESNNIVLAMGETGYELTGSPLRCTAQKIGDGVTAWVDLPYTTSIYDADIVHKTGDETVAGQKRFGLAPLMPNDLRFWMDGQGGRPTLAAWQSSPTTTDLSAVFSSAIAAVQGTYSELYLPPGTLLCNSITYIRQDTETGSTSTDMWKPLILKGAGMYRSISSGNGGQGATIIYSTAAIDIFRVNMNVDGVGLSTTVNDGSGANVSGQVLTSGTMPRAILRGQFINLFFSDLTFKGVAGTQTTGIKGYSSRLSLTRVSFINMWRGWDFYDADVNGAENYNDMWQVHDIQFVGVGDVMFRHAGCDSAVFEGIKCESFQSTARGGFEIWAGSGWAVSQMLVNWLPATAGFIGKFSYSNNGAISGGHFENNRCAVAGLGDFYFDNCNGVSFEHNYMVNYTYAGDVFNKTRPNVYFTSGQGNSVKFNTFRQNRTASVDVAVYSDRSVVAHNRYRNADDTDRAPSTLINAPTALGSTFQQPYFVRVKYTGSVWKIYDTVGTDITSYLGTPSWFTDGTARLGFAACKFIGAQLVAPVRVSGKYEPVIYDSTSNFGNVYIQFLTSAGTLVTAPDTSMDFFLLVS